ncbi:MAG: hypothetical protein K0R25_1299 [Rickettsiaceae bacterium]|jgi:MFS family permease|nr:hypothetical protein [Rickettsiaceae bacterium]
MTIIFLLISAFLFNFSIGINSVSFPLILYESQVPPVFIGIIQGAEILAGVAIAKYLYNLSRKIGTLKIMLIFAIAQATVISILPLYYNFWLWVSLVLVSGISWFGIITLRQSWLNIIVSNGRRSMVLAINSAVLCAGFALGPVLVKIIGAGQYPVFLTSSFLIITSCILLLLAKHDQPVLEPRKENYLQIIKDNKSGFLARFLLDFQVMAVVLFTVIYGIKNNLSAESAGILVSAFMLIGLFDFLIGPLIKNHDLQKVITIGFLGSLFSILFLPFVIQNYYQAVLVFLVYGWFTSLIFIAVSTKINSNQDKQNLIPINSVFQAVGSLGALCGILLVGVFMQIFDKNGFVILIALANLLYLISLIKYKKSEPNKL